MTEAFLVLQPDTFSGSAPKVASPHQANLVVGGLILRRLTLGTGLNPGTTRGISRCLSRLGAFAAHSGGVLSCLTFTFCTVYHARSAGRGLFCCLSSDHTKSEERCCGY